MANNSKNIGWIRHNFLPPSETFIYQSLKALVGTGVEVPVLALNRKSSTKFPYANVTELNSSKRNWFGAARYWLTGRSKRVGEWLKSVHLLHAHMGYTGAHGLSLKRYSGLPLVTSYYGRDVTLANSFTRFAPQYIPYTRARKDLFSEGDRFIVLSKHMAGMLAAQGCPEINIRIVRLGVDLSRFSGPVERKTTDTCTILMVGREIQKKGFDDGIRACAKAQQEGADIRLVILGTNGPLKPKLQQLAATLQLDVQWPDSSFSVPEIMRQADIMLVPSRTADNGDSEGTPTVICEAGASGLPVIGTRHAGISEQIENKTTGMLVDERDIDRMAEAIVTLSNSTDLRYCMGEQGRKKMQKEYSISAHLDSLLSVYQELLP